MTAQINFGKKGIGLLGISGKYRVMDEQEQIRCIEAIIENNISFVDTASVYGEEKPINFLFSQILKQYPKEKRPLVINKIGADLAANSSVNDLINEFEREKKYFEETTETVLLLHRPGLSILDRDIDFYRYLENQRFGNYFGISTNNLEVFQRYCEAMPIDCLQIAINLLDYTAALPLLKEAKKRKVTVIARSVLASGLLTGKYNEDDAIHFKDSIRCRFHESEKNLNIYKERIQRVKNISAFFDELTTKEKHGMNLGQFASALIAQSPYIDSIILGGSNFTQITENCKVEQALPENLLEEVFSTKIYEWTAPYL